MNFTASLAALFSLIAAAAASQYDVELFSDGSCSGTSTGEAAGINTQSGCINVETSHSVLVNTLDQGCNLTLYFGSSCVGLKVTNGTVKFEGEIDSTCLDPQMLAINSFKAEC